MFLFFLKKRILILLILQTIIKITVLLETRLIILFNKLIDFKNITYNLRMKYQCTF